MLFNIKRIIAATVLLAATSTSIFSYSFNDAVEDSQSRTTTHKEKKTSSSSSASDSCFSSICEVFCDVCSSDLLAVWLSLLTSTRFQEFPYEQDNNYIFFLPETNINSSDSIESDIVPQNNFKFTRFSLTESPFFLNEIGWGNDLRLEGMIYFIGPYLEHMNFKDDSDPTSGYRGNLKIGAQVPVIQCDPLTITLLMQWSHWYGDAPYVLKQNGMIFGGEIQSFPFSPIHLDWRISWGFYDKDVKIVDSIMTVGAIFNRYELFGGWKYLSVGNDNKKTTTKSWNGATFGVRVFF